jgi:restriction system protein
MVPACPLCRKAMVRRTVKRGERAGLRFWGCKGHPDCKGTRPIASDDA